MIDRQWIINTHMIPAMVPHDISLHALLIDTRRRGAGVIHVGFHLDDRLRHCRHVESYTKLH